MRKHIYKLKWVVGAFLFSLVCLLIYVTLQQSYRQTANDPQILVAESIATRLSNGERALTRTSTINIAESKALFVLVYNQDGKPIGGTGQLGAGLPTVPKGALEFAGKHGENRITWQPLPLVRFAIVIKPYKNTNSSGYVVVGRSLRETEKRIEQLSNITFWVWLVGMVGVVAGFWIETRRQK